MSVHVWDCHVRCETVMHNACEHHVPVCDLSVSTVWCQYSHLSSNMCVKCEPVIPNITVYHVNKGNVNGQSSPWKSLLRAVRDCVPCQEWYGTRHCQARLCVSWLATMMETHSHSGITRCNIEKIFLECVIMWQTFWCSTQCGSNYP